MQTELVGNLLVGTRAGPDRNGELDRLEVEEIGRQLVGRQVVTRALAVEVRLAGQRVRLYPLLPLVEQLVRNLAQVRFRVLGNPRFQRRGLHPGQPVNRKFDLCFLSSAMIQKAAFEGLATVATGTSRRLLALLRDSLCRSDPGLDLGLPAGRLVGEVCFLEQALVVVAARIDPTAVDVGQRDRIETNACGAGDKGLHRSVVAMVVLHAGRRLHFDHAPIRAGRLCARAA